MLNFPDIVLVVILLLAVGLIFILQLSNQKAGFIQVKVDNAIVGKYPLDKDRTIEINPGTILEIKDGKYRLASSACKKQICVKQGWSSNQPIICVPQKLIISIRKDAGKSESPLTY
ncbi:MAG: NusG domain II-containing protein [Candidatus Cloacimonetes bacterium]|nr:NusG domain II-containing protein [Candidatus Cloacimonadota bacterium]